MINHHQQLRVLPTKKCFKNNPIKTTKPNGTKRKRKSKVEGRAIDPQSFCGSEGTSGFMIIPLWCEHVSTTVAKIDPSYPSSFGTRKMRKVAQPECGCNAPS